MSKSLNQLEQDAQANNVPLEVQILFDTYLVTAP